VNIINKILFVFLAIIYIGCNEEPTSSNGDSSAADNSSSTLDNSNISDMVGNIDEYFYDFDEGESPYVNSKFNRYSGLSIISPLTFDEDSDTLNFASVTDYILSFNLQDGDHDDWDDFIDNNGNGVYDEGDQLVEYELTPGMTQFSLFNEIKNGECFIGTCSDGISITHEDCCLNNSYFQCDGDGSFYETLDDCQNSENLGGCPSNLCARSSSAVFEILEPDCSLSAGDCEIDEKPFWRTDCVDGTSSGVWEHNEDFDPNQSGLYEYNEWVDLNGNGDVWDDCPDLNYDLQLTGGSYPGIYRNEEIVFNHAYGDILKLEWNDDNDRYMVVSVPGTCGQLSHVEYLGNSANISNPAIYPDFELNDPTDSEVTSAQCLCLGATFFTNDEEDSESMGTCMFTQDQCGFREGVYISDHEDDPIHLDGYGVCRLVIEVYEDKYDSTAYITQINTNDVYGFHYTDSNDNGQWNEGEDFEVGDGGYGQYYFDQTELVRSDSIYSTGVAIFEHTFRYPRQIVNIDSIMYKVSTDCNDNGEWDGAESFIDIGDGFYNLGENFIDELNGTYDIGEDFTDENNNGVYDEGEDFIDGNGQWDEGEEFVDAPNGIYDPGEDFIDSAQNSVYDEGEDFTDTLNGVYDEGEEFVDSIGDGLCDDEVEPFVDIGNGIYDNGEFLIFSNGNGVWDGEETFTDIGNGTWDEGEAFDTQNGVWDPEETWVDALNGLYDIGEDFTDTLNDQWDEGEVWVDENGVYDQGEDFADINQNGIRDYYCNQAELGFDSNYNNSWSCENAGHTWTGESFVDGNGVYDEGEAFTDGNSLWDEGEDFVDALNGEYDGPEYYDDINGSGVLDYFCLNGVSWNSNFLSEQDCEFNGYQWSMESFSDVNGNGVWDEGEEFDDSGIDMPEAAEAEEFTDAPNGVYDIGENFEDKNGNGYRDFYCTNEEWPNSLSYCSYQGEEWIEENYTDASNGAYDEGEGFIDLNGNSLWDDDNFEDKGDGVYNLGEPFIDTPIETYVDGDPFIDMGDGICNTSSDDLWVDIGNNIYDEGEDFTDALNEVWDEGEEFIDNLSNGIWDEGEEFIDTGDGSWNIGEEYLDTGNGVWDPAEPFFNFYGATNENVYLSGDSYLDRNCNEKWDVAESRSDDETPFTETDCDDVNGDWINAGEYLFCDIGNGQWDSSESFTDAETGDFITSPNMYTEQYANGDYLSLTSDRAETLVASYNADDSWIAYGVIADTTVVTPRWSNSSYKMLETFIEATTKTKEITKIDSVTSIYSYRFVENMLIDEVSDYAITKATWYEDDERQANYHLYRKDNETQDIMKLSHKSYFILPGVNTSEINGSQYDDYLVFDEYPSEETLFYTYGGLLRDGEYHQTSSTVYSPETFAEYDIYETYEVSYEPAEMSYGNEIYDYGEDFEDEENGVYDLGEEYTDSNNNGIRDFYCKQDGAWNTYMSTQLDIGSYSNQVSCEASSNDWEEESFVDGNGVRDNDEEFIDGPIYIQDVFKITRTRTSVMIGSALEIKEENKIWLAKGKGIVKDEVSFKFNDLIVDGEVVGGDDYDGFYRLEIKNCRHCDELDMYRSSSGMFGQTTEVDFDELNTTDSFNDEYRKIRSYGIQQSPINFNSSE